MLHCLPPGFLAVGLPTVKGSGNRLFFKLNRGDDTVKSYHVKGFGGRVFFTLNRSDDAVKS